MPPGAVASQNALDPNNGVEDVRTGISLKGRKAVHIKDIILGGLIGQISVFECSHRNPAGGFFHLGGFYNLVFHHFFPDEFCDVANELLQPHHAAGAGLERLAILAIHGTKSQEFQFCFWTDDAGLPGCPEHLLEMQTLPLVRQVKDLIRVEIPLPLDQGSQICGVV